MSVVDRYTVEDFREMANTVHDAGLGARGQGIYSFFMLLAIEKESRAGSFTWGCYPPPTSAADATAWTGEE